QLSFRSELFPCKALHETCPIHRNGIQYNTQCTYQEVPVGHSLRIEFCFEYPWYHPVQDTECEEPIPAQCTYVYVCNSPVCKVADGIYAFQAQHRTFKSGHTICSNRYDQELQHHIFPYFIPRATQCQQSIQHTTPRWEYQHQ